MKRPHMRESRESRSGREAVGRRGCNGGRRRGGQAALDYVLILGVVLPLAAVVMRIGPRIMGLAYEMFSVLIAWPLM
jgi:hypothetical protein